MRGMPSLGTSKDFILCKKYKYIPKKFESCVANGGRVRTKSLPDGKFIHICFKNGKSYSGEVKKRQPKLK